MHVRCPHCRNAIEIVEHGVLDEVNCPTCGSSFSLLGTDATTTYSPGMVEVFDHFTLKERIGIGAFGAVWKAWDTKLDRAVAIKVPRHGKLEEADAEKFLREARASAHLKHANIVAVHEVGRKGDTIYIVSELIDGITLSDWLTSQELAPKEAAELCATLAEAIHYAHEHGVIHRDLKPSNVMLDRDNAPHIMDFGLAKREAGEITMTVDGQILGTPAYMSPEQAKGDIRAVDRTSDVYSLGVILFELLTNERPFRGNQRMLLHQVMTEDAPNPRSLNSAISRDLATICLKCLEKDKSRRYATADEFAKDLRRFTSGLPILAREISYVGKTSRWIRRHPSRASLIAACVFALMLVAWAASNLLYQQRLEKTNLALSTSRQSLDKALTRETQLSGELQTALAVAEQRGEHIASLHYASQMLLAQWLGRENATWARELLGECAPDRRNWEWHYVRRLVSGQNAVVECQSQRQVRAAFSSDAGLVATTGVAGIAIWNALDGTHTLNIETPNVRSLCFSPDGRRIAWVGNSTIASIHDLTNGAEVLRLLGHKAPVQAICYLASTGNIVTASTDGEIRTWNSDGELIETKKLSTSNCQSIFLSSEGSVASVNSDNTIDFWNAVDLSTPIRLTGHSLQLRGISFDGAGKRMATIGFDGKARIWSMETGLELHTLNVRGLGYSICFSPDGTRVVTGADTAESGVVSVWDSKQGTECLRLEANVGAVQTVLFSPNGKKIVSTGNGGALIWNATPIEE